MLRRVYRPTCTVLFALLVGVLVQSANGQSSDDSQGLTVADMALDWSRGRFASPLICELDGELVRGIRRVVISPGSSQQRVRVNRIVFVDLEVDNASRCFAELVGDVPNIIGSLQIDLRAPRRSDTARRDFRESLRRKRGFEFQIIAGRLKLQAVTQPPSPARAVDFSGGRAFLRSLEPGSDESRLLSAFSSPRKLLLEISAEDGTKLSFPLYMTDLR
jgi:hypothetical protein